MIYAVSDIHGHYSIYEKIKAKIKPTDTVYVLGDCGDRGPRSWDTITAIYNDPQFVYLKGNHEQMLVDAMLETYCAYPDTWPQELLYSQGGESTFKSWLALPEEERNEWYKRLSTLPELEVLSIGDNYYYLSHAGFNPWTFKKDLLWDRRHFLAVPDPYIHDFKDCYIIHGHTPVQDMWGDGLCHYNLAPEVYAYGHKVNIDLGVYRSGKCCLYNLSNGFTYEILTATD